MGKHTPTDLTPEELNGLVSALTEEQRVRLEEIRSLYSMHISGNQELFDDLFFVRFLRARKFDINKTSAMLNKYFSWRLEIKVDEILRSDFSYIRDTVRQYFPHGFHGVDRLGRPIYIERMGQGSCTKLLQNLSTEQLTRYYVQRYEYLTHVMMPAASMKHGKPVEQLLTLVDLRGFSISQINTKLRAFLTAMSAVTQNYYPEMLGKLLFINASTFFSALWQILSPLLDAKTLSKISVISSKTESKAIVNELVDADQLPMFLGGIRPDDDWMGSDFGPWGDPEIIEELKRKRPHVPTELYDVKGL
ncbi:Phosphatidylinositol/phosphatidylcholine transfer protein SFH2 [Babesia sp. Xinjiang]|uniref:Phosphatidylinositol/phosphatidylcholine transfer protein SFH2 n=1 Tax=Babesia sp. Xinjiang TaxID=462227 RepID=UPI000A228DF9|nr:Phosphatidylinositol/phosphatidylcholine transfer protein SFH2 [Babesia sp. Xinjiang]XP_028872038.1 Phosphatidylinositol/phosphatidylcholine transfer protein SFH2 [Babesia sp. Xinjiang]ORM41563.1 Phosphatidylinositol/phosphatidylcholine transfer protein SFH2 [Babesia sp. Xinjiang]ORM41582.1 Phosphatidylinositol/phosphatidylcholine transfer protein SFH2 [Babesia sp. Xinjiang]